MFGLEYYTFGTKWMATRVCFHVSVINVWSQETEREFWCGYRVVFG